MRPKKKRTPQEREDSFYIRTINKVSNSPRWPRKVRLSYKGRTHVIAQY